MMTHMEENTWMLESILGAKCESGHEFKPMLTDLTKRVFNICSKNFISQENSSIHKCKKGKIHARQKRVQKVEKLRNYSPKSDYKFF